MAMPYVQFGFNVRCEYLHVCLFVFIFGEFYVPFEIFPHLYTSHDEILITLWNCL